MVRFRSASPRPSASSRARSGVCSPSRCWATVAIVASAALGGRFADPVHAAEPVRLPLPCALVRIEQSIGPWETPDEIFAAAYRVGLAPGQAGPDDAVMTQAPKPSRQDPPVLRFGIPPGPLAGALEQFEALTGVAVRIADDLVRNLTSPGVTGRFTAEQALQQLLVGTNFSFRFTAPTAVIVEIRVTSDAISVTDHAATVSSAKFTEPLIDTPKTITVVPRAVIEQQGATTLRDILRNVPGITMQAGEGGAVPGDNLTLRGFSASNDIFVDGVRDVGPYSRDAFNLEQVEVIKGPSSSFGGRGSTGGAINLAIKAPIVPSIRQGTLTIGNAGHQRVTVDMNERVPVLGASTAVRLNAMWQDAGVPGRDVVNNGSWAIAPSIGFGLGTPTRMTASYQHLKQDNVPDYGLPWGTSTNPATGEVFPTGAFNASPAIDQSNFYGLDGYDFEDISNDVATAVFERDFVSASTLRSVTRYGETHRNSAITAPRPPNRQLQRREMRNETFVNQTGLTARRSTGPVTHGLSTGFEIGRETIFSRNSGQTTNQPQTNIRQPNPNDLPFGPMPAITGNPGETTTNTLGAYFFDTVTLGRTVELNAGLRWDRSDVDYRQTNLATGEVTDLGRVDRMVSYQAGVVYKPRESGSVYVGYGTSFNPASDAGNVTALSDAENAANNVNLAPERSRNFEVGTKWSGRGGRVLVNAAFFRTEKTNARTRNLNTESFVLAGRQRVQGVELGVSGHVAPTVTTFVSYSHLDSEIVDSANDIEDGRDLAFTPERTASLWATWQASEALSVGGGGQFMDAVFRNTTSDLKVPSYWLVNAMAAYEVNSHLTLRLNATNLTDKSYVDRVGGGHYIPGARRSIQLTTSVGF